MRTRFGAVAVVLGLLMSLPPVLVAGAGPAAPERYTAQQIDWRRCLDPGQVPGLPVGSDALECGSYRVPRDWDHPDSGVDLTIAVSRLRPPGEPRGSLLTNPGGPGVPGRAMPLLFLETARLKVLETFEVIGIDVRGTGASTNISCASLGDVGRELDPRDRRRENTDLILDAAAFVAGACQNGAGSLGPFITTAQTVQDLDLLRILLGRDKISWLGYSGGAWIGAHYATYHPDHLDRVVLDASPEFTASWQQVFARQPLGFQRRFNLDFLPYVAANNSSFGLGDTPEKVNAVYEMLRARLAAEPLAWGDNGVVYSQELDLVLVSAMYGKESFQTAAKDLRTLRDMTERRGSSHETATNSFERDATARRIARARQQLSTAGLMPLAPDATKATFLSIACGDTPWTGDRASLLAESQQAGEHYPLLGWYELYDPCVFWHRPPLPVRVPDGTGVPPVLMIHSERDPAAPIEGARAARDAFAGARLLTVTDEGDHGTYAIRGNVCVDNVVESYLVDGVIPALGATCPGQPMPAPALLPDTREFIDLLPLGRAAERTIRLGRLAGLLPS